MFRRIAQLSLLALLSFNVFAANDDLDDLRTSNIAQDEWRLIKQDRAHDIKAYDKRDLGKNLRSFKVEYEVETDLDTIARVYFDFDNYRKWFYQVQEAKLLKKVSATEFYYYIVHRAPPTLPDRDAIIHATIEPYTAKRGYALLTLKSIPNYFPAKPPLVRMIAEDMTVKWTPMGGGKIHGVAEGYVDPGGVVPSWAINYVQRQAPYQTALGFQRVLKSPFYKDAKEKPFFSLTD
ncbi:hypothetical protein FK216_00065 [Moraxellaceae bacterium AER2_44_116]|nr:hypothetical protein [Moraxellaceae bacterium]TQC99686.1 hypothetical protein FK216_00065 [Moraxellaceae bacterium AER2_44_116]